MMCVSADSCDDVHVTDVTIDVGDDAVSVKSGLHWKTKKKVAAQNYLFERVSILHRNFAIGSAVSGDVLNITFKDSVIGDTPPSGSCTLDPCPGSGSIGSPWDLPMNVPADSGPRVWVPVCAQATLLDRHPGRSRSRRTLRRAVSSTASTS